MLYTYHINARENKPFNHQLYHPKVAKVINMISNYMSHTQQSGGLLEAFKEVERGHESQEGIGWGNAAKSYTLTDVKADNNRRQSEIKVCLIIL